MPDDTFETGGEYTPGPAPDRSKPVSKTREAVKSAGKEMSKRGAEEDFAIARQAASKINEREAPAPKYVDVPAPKDLPTYHRGGMVRKTGPARLRKGERVLSRKESRKFEKRGGSRGR